MLNTSDFTCFLVLQLLIKRIFQAQEIEGVKIFHYSGGLSFASIGTFKELLNRKTQVDAAAILRRRIKLNGNGIEAGDDLLFKCIILDFSCLTFVDPSGVDSLKALQEDYERLGISMFITGCSSKFLGVDCIKTFILTWIRFPGPVYEVIEKCDKITKNQKKFVIFPTVHDAVLFSLVSMDNNKESWEWLYILIMYLKECKYIFIAQFCWKEINLFNSWFLFIFRGV